VCERESLRVRVCVSVWGIERVRVCVCVYIYACVCVCASVRASENICVRKNVYAVCAYICVCMFYEAVSV
jgi:hypothetical protein